MAGEAGVTDERRLVTVLFADVVGSTGMGEELDPEDLRALLGRYFATSREVVEAHGGTVEKFIGDAVMAVFGLPRAHDDDPVRALHAALQLRDRVRDDPELGERLPIRVGVNTGDVVAARDAAGGADFLITGDAVNAGARLQQAAEPWSILVGGRTARSARGNFDFGPPAPIEAKGKTGGLIAHELRGLVTKRDGPRVRTPFVGRDADMAQLELLAERSFGEGIPYLVTILAPAGTGKTRLLEEFLGRLRARHPEAAIAVAQCLPYGQRLTYWPLRALLLRLLELDEDADGDRLRRVLSAWLTKHGVEDSASIVRLVAATIGAGDSETNDRAALLAAWRTVIETASMATPLVLAIEDLHWSSDSLLDLLEFVLQPRADAPILMIALSRPELLDRRPSWGGGRRNHLSLALSPLPDRSVEELVRNLVEGASDDIVEGVVRRAEGNPFYAGEIVQSVVERAGTLDDMGRIEEALNTLPDTVQATVLARLDLLDVVPREVLKVGAVFGRTFRPVGIAALAPSLAEHAASACEELADRDLIRPSGADGFVFRHILIREVAYQTLPRSERARLHAAAAHWLEEGPADADLLAELIAFHYREAATLGKSSAGGLDPQIKGKVVDWLERAAHVARAGAASLEAIRHLRGAIEFADEQRQTELYEQLGEVDLSGPDRVRSFERARELAREQGRPVNDRLRIAAHLQLVYLREVGSVATRPTPTYLEQLREENARLAAEADDPSALALYHIAEGFLPFWYDSGAQPARDEGARVADFEAAERAAEIGLHAAEQSGDLRLVSIALDALGSLAQERGDWRQARDLNLRRVGYERQVDLVEVIDAHAMVVWNETVLGDLDRAEQIATAGMALLQPGQIPAWALHLAAWRTLALRLRGDWDKALQVIEHARQLWLESGRPSAGYAVRGFASACDIARARRQDELYERYRAVIADIDAQFPPEDPRHGTRYTDRDMEWIVQAARGDIFRLRLRPEARTNIIGVVVDARTPLPIPAMTDLVHEAEQRGLRLLEGQAQRALAMATGNASHLDRAVELFEGSHARPGLARALVERGLLRGDTAEVEAGRRILEALGDVEQLDRYDGLSGGNR